MNAKTLMLAAALGLAGNAMAEGTKEPGKQAEQREAKEKEKAEQAAEAAPAPAPQQPQVTEPADAEAKAEMDAMMAQEIQRRVLAAEQAPEKRVFGKIIGFDEQKVIIDIGGAALPLAVNHETKIDGEAIPRTKRIQTHLKTELKPGQLVSVTYDLKKMENVALSIEELKAEAQPQGMQREPMQQPQQQMGMEPEKKMEKMPSEPAPSGAGTSDY